MPQTGERRPVVDVLAWDEPGMAATAWDLGAVHRLPLDTLGAAAAMQEVVRRTAAEWLLLWSPALGPPPANVLPALVADRADVVHAGLLLGMQGLPRELDLVQPTWTFVVDPPADRQATSWRLSLRACLVRRDVVAALGHVDPAFSTLTGAALDLGWRWLARGALVVHDPRLLGPDRRATEPLPLPSQDRYLFLLRHYPPKWARYVLARRCLTTPPHREVAGFRRACEAMKQTPPRPATTVYERPEEADDTGAAGRRVSVILPTLGRYGMLADLLGDLSRQTVTPHQVVCVDQNPPAARDPAVYARCEHPTPEVIYQDGRGQWLARNAAVERATGDLLLFLDDDSRIAPDFVERHLEALDRYRADVSAGASLSVVGAPVPESYGFFRAADQFDSGNAMVRREAMTSLGGFDRQYDRMRAGDADFGMRVHLAGGLAVHNPLAWRSHLKAEAGGLRSFGSWDSYRQRGILTPRPLPSVVYYAQRHFSPRQTREGLLLGLAAATIPYELKRRASRTQWLRFSARELLLLPLSAARLGRSLGVARRMARQGPLIPPVAPGLSPTPGRSE